MISYKDKTFCKSDCKNRDCKIRLTNQVLRQAKSWWGGDGAPIATSDFAKDCKAYKK